MSEVMNKFWASVTLAALGARDRLRREEGQSTVEYVLVVAAIAGVVAAVFTVTGTSSLATKLFTKLSNLIGT